jgi:hypothetical protein
MPLIQKQQKTLALSQKLITKEIEIASLEIGLTISETFDKAIIKSVFKDEFQQVGFSVVNVLVTRFIDSFGFSTKLNPTQIETLTVDVLENFQYETLEDIIIFLKMARTGKFGSTGRGVDSNLILGDWFPKYLKQKAILREQNYSKDKNKHLENTNAVEKYYAKIKAKKQKEEERKKVLLEIDEMCKNMDKQLLEDTILDWNKKEEMKPFLDYIKLKRLIIK